ncbi:flagellar biosynthesis/type III secretory pathway chaperone [Keratinibaculum paraultunense]|uniref:Flagellar biosynthesis/type III secretory pathway chaperone n=1 Tax=Keratinibaculum paraultunense TaxID=1278232 RepID=A0A4R3KU80_9FIRM|nr:flagellar protein FlgN [Keratinibaculum paraultunense]QQY79146.1 flagellar protein FlgN [Keratinibaculum paraultunense]TCS88530.1 flagellar biosynthesis/type III secretory pathway chaperone [Keratinibaculum paraultunense]
MTFKDELISILEKERDILYELKDITFEKTDILVENQVEKLENVNKLEENLINQMATFEEERLKLMYNWGLDINMTLNKVIENIPDEGNELEVLKEELLELMMDIQSRNALNNDLILENLQWLDFNMNLISNAQGPTTYGKGDKKQSNNSIFDRKV